MYPGMEGVYQRLRLELMGIYLGLYSGMVSFYPGHSRFEHLSGSFTWVTLDL